MKAPESRAARPAGGHGLRRQASTTGAIAGIAVLGGLLVDVMIAARFGAGPITDAFFVAARIPLGVSAIAIAAANQALVPALVTSLTNRGERVTWRLVTALLLVTLAGGALVVALATLLAPVVVVASAPGLPARNAAIAAQLMPYTFAMIPLATSSEVLRSLLNARSRFALGAAMNIALSVPVAILVLVLPRDPLTLGVAYAAGSGLQFLFMAGCVLADGYRPARPSSLRESGFSGVASLMVRPTIAAGLNPAARIGEQIVLSFLPAGSITIVSYAYRLISAIGGTVFFRSVMVTLVPRLTAAYATHDRERGARISAQGVRLMLTVSLPLTAAAVALAAPLTLVVFQRGRFDRGSALLLAALIIAYAPSLVGSALQRALLAPFFAQLDTRTPLRNTVYGVAANLLLLLPCVIAFGLHSRQAVIGVGIAYSIAQYVNVAHAAWRAHASRIRLWEGARAHALRLLLASVAALLAMQVAGAAVQVDQPAGRIQTVLLAALVAAVGAAVLSAVIGATRGVGRRPATRRTA